MQAIEIVAVSCPCCCEPIDLAVDTSVPEQTYVEDCSVCCRPMVISARVDGDTVDLVAVAENE